MFRRIISILITAVAFLTLSDECVAQKEGNDVFVPIAKYIKNGDADALSAWMDNTVDITIASQGGPSSRTQAREIMKSFFQSYTPQNFTISHTAGRSNMKYILADLTAGGESFRVSLFLSSKDGTFKIQQLKIDRK